MKEINCSIIQDVLPLYIDGVVSQETKEMVENHLEHCEQCKKDYESMNHELYLPIENKTSFLKSIKKKWRKKKVYISLISVLITAFILFGAFSFIFHYETVVPYSKDLIEIEMQDGNQLVSHYYGESYAGVNVTHPFSVEVDGKKKNVSFIYYTKTIADSPERELIKNGKISNEKGYFFNLPESEKVDAVYYGDYDTEKITREKDSWESILERSVSIWEK